MEGCCHASKSQAIRRGVNRLPNGRRGPPVPILPSGKRITLLFTPIYFQNGIPFNQVVPGSNPGTLIRYQEGPDGRAGRWESSCRWLGPDVRHKSIHLSWVGAFFMPRSTRIRCFRGIPSTRDSFQIDAVKVGMAVFNGDYLMCKMLISLSGLDALMPHQNAQIVDTSIPGPAVVINAEIGGKVMP